MSARPPGLVRRAAPAALIAVAAVTLVSRFDHGVAALASAPATSSVSLVQSSKPVELTSSTMSASTPSAAPAETSSASPSSSAACGTRSVGDTVQIVEQGGHGGGNYGQITVTAWIAGGTVCAVTSNYQPYDGHSQRIDSQAVPQLDQEAVKAGNASFDTVSGATYTSKAYQQSLQSAIDRA